jgi:hypothetical protein
MIWKISLILQLVVLFSILTVTVFASSVKSLFKAVTWIFQPVVKTNEHYA